MKNTTRHKWQYSLKTYLLLMALVAAMIGWWCDRRRLQMELLEAKRRIQFLETAPYYDLSPGRHLPR